MVHGKESGLVYQGNIRIIQTYQVFNQMVLKPERKDVEIKFSRNKATINTIDRLA